MRIELIDSLSSSFNIAIMYDCQVKAYKGDLTKEQILQLPSLSSEELKKQVDKFLAEEPFSQEKKDFYEVVVWCLCWIIDNKIKKWSDIPTFAPRDQINVGSRSREYDFTWKKNILGVVQSNKRYNSKTRSEFYKFVNTPFRWFGMEGVVFKLVK